MAWGYAKTAMGVAASDLTFSAEFLQLEEMTQVGDPNPVNFSVNNQWGAHFLDMTIRQVMPPVPPFTYEIIARSFVFVPTIFDEVVVGSWTSGVWSGPSSYALSPTTESGPFDVYKKREEEPRASTNLCSTAQLAMPHVWGSDDYDFIKRTGIGATTYGLTSQVLAPSQNFLPGSTVTIAINLLAGSHVLDPVNGDVGRIYDLNVGAGSNINFDGYRDPVVGSHSGVHVEGRGTSVYLVVDNYQVAGRIDHRFSLTVYADTRVTYNLALRDWDTAHAGGQFQVPADSGIGTKTVSAPYSETVTYSRKSWDPSLHNLPDLEVSIDPTWAADNEEDVDPDDLPCLIEERPLDMTASTFAGLKVRRKPSVSWQYPSDATDWPSLWASSDMGMSVTNAGGAPRITTIQVAATASDAEVSREFDYTTLQTRLASAPFGWPRSYQFLHHLPDEDVWAWNQYPVIKLSYDCDLATSVDITVDYFILIVSDNHTGPRVVTFEWEPHSVTKTLSLANGVAQVVYTDLQEDADRHIMIVDKITLSDIQGDGGTDPWTFVINNWELIASEPDGATETGKFTLTHTTPRPDSGGLPIAYVWLRCTADGTRCFKVPDEWRTQLGEQGVPGVNGSAGGVNDFMETVGYYYRTIARQEGMEVEDITNLLAAGDAGLNCIQGAALFDASYEDAFGNHMLEDLYTGDVKETLDSTIIDSVSAHSTVPIVPYVGVVYPCSGTPDPLPCDVTKIIHGNLHGIVRSGGVRVSGQNVWTWERDVGGGGETSLGLEATDLYGRWSRSGKSGVRELKQAGVSTTSDSDDVATWYRVLNELRRWVQAGAALALGEPHMDEDAAGLVYQVYTDAEGAVYCRHLDNADVWTDVQQPFPGLGYSLPSITTTSDGDGSLVVAATRDTTTDVVRSRTKGILWPWVEVLGVHIGNGLQGTIIWERAPGIVYAVGWILDQVVLRASGRKDLQAEALYTVGGTPFYEVLVFDVPLGVDEEVPRMAVIRHTDGSILVSVNKASEIVTLRCRSYLEGFLEVV